MGYPCDRHFNSLFPGSKTSEVSHTAHARVSLVFSRIQTLILSRIGGIFSRATISSRGNSEDANGLTAAQTQTTQCRRLCQCAQGGLSLCHAYRVRKMRNKGRSRRLAAAANSASAASAEATSPTSPGADDDEEVRRPFGNVSDRALGSRAGSGGTGPSDADTTSGDVRLNIFGGDATAVMKGNGDGASAPAEARGVETRAHTPPLAVLDEQQLWAMGLLGNEHETKNLSREESAHSEIWDEPAAWVDSETQLVPELRNELLELMHQKRPRSTEPGDVDEYLVL